MICAVHGTSIFHSAVQLPNTCASSAVLVPDRPNQSCEMVGHAICQQTPMGQDRGSVQGPYEQRAEVLSA